MAKKSIFTLLVSTILIFTSSPALFCLTIVETAKDRYPAAQAVAYAAANLPVDFQHIGNLSQFEPDTDLTTDDYDTIAGLNATLVVNKAGDYMLLNGKALAGNYIDQFVHTQFVIDTLQTNLQKYLNRKNFPIYNDATIKEMTQTINAVSPRRVLRNG